MDGPNVQSFESIPFPVRSFGGLNACRYLVFTAPQQSITVEAETAAEALQKSGVKEAWRIVRHMPGREVLLDMTKIGMQGMSQQPTQAPPAEVAQEAPPAVE